MSAGAATRLFFGLCSPHQGGVPLPGRCLGGVARSLELILQVQVALLEARNLSTQRGTGDENLKTRGGKRMIDRDWEG